MPRLCKGCSLAKIRGWQMLNILRILWTSEEGQDIAEYAVMLAVILVLVIDTVRTIGGNANDARPRRPPSARQSGLPGV
jgi:Flp pilus assembly pilin Flp